jgi:hypothetical protein
MSIALQADSNLPQGYILVNGTAAATVKQDGSISAPSLSAANVTSANLNGKLNGDLTWLIRTSNYTANAGDRVSANTSGGAWTLRLPSSPSTGDTVVIADGATTWSTNNLTVSASNTIQGLNETLVCNVNGTMFTMLYNGSTWRVLI